MLAVLELQLANHTREPMRAASFKKPDRKMKIVAITPIDLK